MLADLRMRTPNNLPVQRTAFLGREAAMAALSALLEPDPAPRRLITLTGAGGSGKTRLAIEVGARALRRFPDGVWLASLAAVSEAGGVALAVSDALGLQDAGGRPPVEAIAEALADRRALLTLDNCEHLADACADLAGRLLADCPRLTLLVTSRVALGVPAEQTVVVPPLDLPDPDSASLSSIASAPAVRLFLDRAATAQPGFHLTTHNAPAVALICRRLDGLPLAIELAAARVRDLPLTQIANRLDARFRLLTVGPAGRRRPTLRTSLDWSYDLLGEGECGLLRALAVFAGGWSFAAAEAVGAPAADGAAPLIELLDGLAHKSLVQVDLSGAEPRYGMLETIREYAREKLLGAGEAGAARERHARYFLELAEQAEPALNGPAQAEWLRRLEQEHDNLRAALDWALASNDGETAARLTGALGRFWSTRGHWSEGRQWLAAALAAGAAPPEARAKALRAAGTLALSQANFAEARALLEESLSLSRAVGSHTEAVLALERLGAATADERDLDSGVLLYEESLALARSVGDQRGIANALRSLGRAAIQQGQMARAAALHQEALGLYEALGDTWGRAWSELSLGDVARLEGDYAGAVALYEEALRLFQSLEARGFMAYTLHTLAAAALEQGDIAGAQQLAGEALALFRAVGSRDGAANVARTQGLAALQAGGRREAAERCAESLAELRTLGHKSDLAASLAAMATVAAARGHAVRAICLSGAAAALRESSGARMDTGEQALHERAMARLRAELDEAAFAAALATGRAMPLDLAVAYAAAEANA
jgi:non-specific serine/threonine protein kinase